MMAKLPPWVGYCRCAGRTVIVDLSSDRYFCVSPDLEVAPDQLAADKNSSAEKALRVHLGQAGLIARDGGGSVREPLPLLPEVDIRRKSPQLAVRHEVLHAFAAQCYAMLRLRVGSVLAVIAPASAPAGERRDGPTQSELSRAAAIADAFARTGPVLGIADRCLARAVACRSLCRSAGVPALLVLGVRLDPFNAHAWVQLGPYLLVGDLEQVRLFTPILACR